jgi:hypothetical protein
MGGSFTREVHFRKWYLMGLLGIFDFMAMGRRHGICQLMIIFVNYWRFHLMLAEETI